jgi:hypothetical protein
VTAFTRRGSWISLGLSNLSIRALDGRAELMKDRPVARSGSICPLQLIRSDGGPNAARRFRQFARSQTCRERLANVASLPPAKPADAPIGGSVSDLGITRERGALRGSRWPKNSSVWRTITRLHRDAIVEDSAARLDGAV